MKKKFLILTLVLSFCSLTAYAATNLNVETNSNYKVASPSNADDDDVPNDDFEETAENPIPETELDPEKATPSDATPFDEDVFLSLSETEDYPDILSLEGDMMAQAQYLYEMGEIKRPISSEDIDYEKAVKIFMDGEDSVTKLPTITKGILYDYLEDKEYIWELPINIDSQTISFTFNVGKPLDDDLVDLLTAEQQEEITANEGDWIIVRTAWNDINRKHIHLFISRKTESIKILKEKHHNTRCFS